MGGRVTKGRFRVPSADRGLMGDFSCGLFDCGVVTLTGLFASAGVGEADEDLVVSFDSLRLTFLVVFVTFEAAIFFCCTLPLPRFFGEVFLSKVFDEFFTGLIIIFLGSVLGCSGGTVLNLDAALLVCRVLSILRVSVLKYETKYLLQFGIAGLPSSHNNTTNKMR